MPSDQIQSNSYRSKYEKAGLFSKLHFTWVIDFVKLINNNNDTEPTLNDIPSLG